MADTSRGTDGQDSRSFLARQCLWALSSAPVAMAVVDARAPGAPVTFANRECETITGYASGELLGHGLDMLHGAETDPAAVDQLRRAMSAGRASAVELTNYRKDGEAFLARVAMRPLHDEAGEVAAFIAVLTDVTESVRSEARARHSEARLRNFTEAIPLPMLTLRLDGTILRANAAAEEALGVAANGLPGRRVEDFAGEDEITDDSLCHRMRRQDSVQRVEIAGRRPDGQMRWLLASTQQFDVDGDKRIVMVFQDVTDLKVKERRLTEANEEAERNIRARMRFLAAASHDLRQPLQAMALFASALDHHVSTPQGRTIVQSLKISLRGMEEMFDALLDMSKLDAGVMKSDPQIFLINDLFEQLETTYGPQAEAAGLSLRMVPSSAAVKSDPRLLARVIGNFLSNAIRYTRSGGILLGVRRHGSRLRVAVYDTGPGIPESQRLDIFREFRQGGAANVAGRGGGTGLGLAIVQRLARLLGHPLDVRSRVGHGSTFAIDVPLAEEFLPSPTAEDEGEDIPDLSGAVVVVVDDDPDIQDALTLLLTEWGCTPVVASTADEALAALDAQAGKRPDVILADLHLRQHESGIDAVATLRERIGAHVPAFVFTGDTGAAGNPSDQQSLKVLRKPLDPLRLRLLLGEAIRHGEHSDR
ncbi:MAG TPA: PAS domain S-box protein [Magnetospirillum sp.]|nr:PAS domain S-box protein [Magnetospirillum sp.]